MRLSRSTYYYELNKIDAVKARNKELMDEIKEIFVHHKYEVYSLLYVIFSNDGY